MVKEINMKTETQSKWAKEMLLDTGRVTRNQALKRYISRLGAIICDLKKAGWAIHGGYIKTPRGQDYEYVLMTYVPTKRVSRK